MEEDKMKGFRWDDEIRTICISGKFKRRLQFNKKRKYKDTTIWNNNFYRERINYKKGD